MLTNVDDVDALLHVFPDVKILAEQAARLRTQRLSIFADEWSAWLGTLLADHIRLSDPTRCRGGIDGVEPLPVSRGAQWRVTGWAWDNEHRASPERIVFADSTGKVVGYALGGYSSKPGSGAPKHSGWQGHVAAQDATSATAYALLDPGRTACALTHR